ncbi:hypothetical protein L6452_28121 [Arctium lappa]|uniref:Uncharacterized protein n=1 Tax=Arctium lappa TaxID=4217 RepID=A0ACB8ZYF4_ARCLA|nr:hypothetical protein L6452_28121 [Arctium lappa]
MASGMRHCGGHQVPFRTMIGMLAQLNRHNFASLVSKYKNTPKEEMPLQDSSDEASIDIKFTNPKGDSSEEYLIESDKELESTDLNNTQNTFREDEELDEVMKYLIPMN